MVWNHVISVFFAGLESSRSKRKINTTGCAPMRRIFFCILNNTMMAGQTKTLSQQWLEVCTKAAHLIPRIFWICPRWGMRSVKPRGNMEHVMASVCCHSPDKPLIMSSVVAVWLSAQRWSWGTPDAAARGLWNAVQHLSRSFPLQNMCISRELDSFPFLQFQNVW